MTVVYLLVALAIILALGRAVHQRRRVVRTPLRARRRRGGQRAGGRRYGAARDARADHRHPLHRTARPRTRSASAPSSARRSCSRAWPWSSPAARSSSSPGAAAARATVDASTSPSCAATCRYFLIAYGLAMAAGLDPGAPRQVDPLAAAAGRLRLSTSGETMRAEGDLEGETKPLYFHRHPVMPHRRRIILQVLVATVGIVVGARALRGRGADAERLAGRRPAARVAAPHADRHRAAREVQLGDLGAGRARTRWRSATSPGRWSSRARSRCRSACSSRSGS